MDFFPSHALIDDFLKDSEEAKLVYEGSNIGAVQQTSSMKTKREQKLAYRIQRIVIRMAVQYNYILRENIVGLYGASTLT